MESKTKNNQTITTELIDTENRFMVTRGGEWVVGKMGEGGQKIETCSYKINKSWDCNVQHGGSIVNKTVFYN